MGLPFQKDFLLGPGRSFSVDLSRNLRKNDQKVITTIRTNASSACSNTALGEKMNVVLIVAGPRRDEDEAGGDEQDSVVDRDRSGGDHLRSK